MNKQLTHLLQISEKTERRIIGLMSGTSLDGLDVALCEISGWGRQAKIDLHHFETIAYDDALRKRLGAVQSKETTDMRLLTILHSELGFLYGDIILQLLEKWRLAPADIDIIASHGQTVFHAPAEDSSRPHSTLQIVDADHIAQKTGIITISDFRQKHTAAGGEGAPLAGIFDEVLYRSPDHHRLLLNIGGIANFTWLPIKSSTEQVITVDSGPGNTLINEAMQKYFGRMYDEGGKVAAKGEVHKTLLKYILLQPYFSKPLPKTTGQEDFRLSYIEHLMAGHNIELSPQDLVATLTAVTVQSISHLAEELAGTNPFEVFVSGGGVHNAAIMQGLKEKLPLAMFRDFEELGLSPDAKEAAMMAFFANELVAGEGFSIPGVTDEKVHLGKISFPN